MNKITDQQLQEISNLIDKKKWEEAENILINLPKTEDSKINYYLGLIYDAWDNPNKDKNKATKYFSLSAESTHPVSGAFIRLARNEKNKTHSIRILRKGLQSFPGSEPIYYHLLIFTESVYREDIYKEIILKDSISERIKIKMATTYFGLKEYNKAIEILSDVVPDNEWDQNILTCIKGFSLYEMNRFTEANKIFSKLIEEDLNHKLNYIPHFGLVLVLLNQEKLSKAEQLIEEIPFDKEIYEGAYPVLDTGPWNEIYLDAREYFFRAIDLIITKSKQRKILGIARGLRGVLRFEVSEEDITKKGLQTEIKRDLEFSLKEFPQNKVTANYLFRLFKDSNPSKAWQYLVRYSLYDEEYFYEDDFIENANNQLFQEILNYLKEISSKYYNLKNLSKSLIRPVINRLFKHKQYKDLLLITCKLEDTQLTDADIIFETAYSYYEEKDLEASKKYYELYMAEKGETNAGLNNLGLIFEKRGDFLKAKELFKKASQIDSEDEICRRNLKRVEEELKKKGKLENELQEALEKYHNESPYVQKKILDFNNHKNDDGLIICSYRQAPQLLRMSGTRAVDFLNKLLTEKFFIKVTGHEYETFSNVYRLNPYLEPELAKIKESLKSEDELIALCERLNIESLNQIGYNEDLLKNIAKMSSSDLKLMMQRDLKETALAVILKQNKSALVLSGSIIEAILTDRITAKGFIKYKIGNDTKAVLKMDLNDLLEVAEKEKIIDSTMAHLAHGVRGYRNLIHPGVEQRKNTIQVNDSNVELAWGILKKLLNEIK